MAHDKGRVLAIDDDPAVLETLAGTLGNLGYDVLQSVDGTEGYSLAVKHLPDLVMLDVMMPDPDGFEVCRMLKANPETALIPVVFLTGRISREARIAGLDAGASDFLSKPCDLSELEARVRNLVAFHRATRDLHSAEEMMFMFARILEARDRETGDHCARLARLSVKLGQRLSLDGEQLKALHRGAFLHDIGKVGIPDAVLLKPSKLNASEWEIVKRHPEIGCEICKPLASLTSVLPLIRHHHERFDGSGYPDGLVGENIPLLARVFQVVDIYDALANKRPYREGLPEDEVIATIREEVARGLWDREIVDEFLVMLSVTGQATNDDDPSFDSADC